MACVHRLPPAALCPRCLAPLCPHCEPHAHAAPLPLPQLQNHCSQKLNRLLKAGCGKTVLGDGWLTAFTKRVDCFRRQCCQELNKFCQGLLGEGQRAQAALRLTLERLEELKPGLGLRDFETMRKVFKLDQAKLLQEIQNCLARTNTAEGTAMADQFCSRVRLKCQKVATRTIEPPTGKAFFAFFVENSKVLKYIQLSQDSVSEWKELHLASNEVVPRFHRIAISGDELYLAGGLHQPSRTLRGDTVYSLRLLSDKKLKELGRLNQGRMSQGMCVAGSELFLCGGLQDGVSLSHFQCFKVKGGKSKTLQKCRYPCLNCTLLASGEYILKHGGVDQRDEAVPQIEIYHRPTAKWHEVVVALPVLALAGCIPLGDELLIFGGYEFIDQAEPSAECYSLRLRGGPDCDFEAQPVRLAPLPSAECFMDNLWTRQGQRVYVMQNVSREGGYSLQRRKVLFLERGQWHLC